MKKIISEEIINIFLLEAGLNGGIVLEIEGNGFSPNTTVTICTKTCPIVNMTQTTIYCTVSWLTGFLIETKIIHLNILIKINIPNFLTEIQFFKGKIFNLMTI